MTDNQQIEEIQLIMLNAVSKRYFSTKDVKLNNDTEFLKQAEALYNANYRQVPESAIVVDKEYLKTELQGLELQACKETAKEIFSRLLSIGSWGTQFDWNDYFEIDMDDFRKLAKQFGVEVE